MTDTDIWNWISAFIQSFAETFLLVNVYCAFLGQPRIKKYVAYSDDLQTRPPGMDLCAVRLCQRGNGV